MEIPNIYRGNYRRLAAIPFIFLAISLYLIFISPGIPAGIDLRGGILITLQTTSDVNPDMLTQSLASELGVRDVGVKTAPGPMGTTGVEIEIEQNEQLAEAEKGLREFYIQYGTYTEADYAITSTTGYLQSSNLTDAERSRAEAQLGEATAIRDAAWGEMLINADKVFSAAAPLIGKVSPEEGESATGLMGLVASTYADAKGVYRDKVLGVLRSQMDFTDVAYKDVSPSLSEFFLQKTYEVIFISLIFSAVVVLLIFRTLVPSFAVMFSAINDIIFALGAMALFQIPLTLASVGALLMLIGFSLETNLLVTIRVLKRGEGSPSDRAYGAMKTGVTMQTAALIAFVVLLVLSIFTQLPAYYQIASVAIAGLIGDIIATWGTNAVLILGYQEKKQKGGMR